MSAQVITFEESADPDVVAKIEAARAALKPCCMRCRKVLPKRDVEARLCSDRAACTVRAITRAPGPLHRVYTRR